MVWRKANPNLRSIKRGTVIVSRVPFLFLRDLVGYGMGKRGIILSLGAGIPNQLLEIAVFLGTQLTILGIEECPV